jgi:uncharacterized protein DUF3592
MKFRKFAYIALGLGALLLFISLVLWNKTRLFVAHATTAQGVVTDLVTVRDKDGGSDTYKPEVKFSTEEGKEITFTSSFSSRPPAYDVGESVPVLYLPRQPHEARIKGFGSLWSGCLILAGLGATFSLAGYSILRARKAGTKKRDYLMAYGNAIQTDVQGVERNTSVAINGRNPWRITSQYLDPATNKVRVFHSENLWFDPAKFVTSKQVTVLLDPKDPQRYHMDVSFLPEMDEAR